LVNMGRKAGNDQEIEIGTPRDQNVFFSQQVEITVK
jgi:hypothetical protein